MKQLLAALLALTMLLTLAACAKNTDTTPSDAAEDSGTTLTYGSADYTRINPAMDEHGRDQPAALRRPDGSRRRE